MNDNFTVSPVSRMDILINCAAINTRKHYFCMRVIEPQNNLNCTMIDFSTLRGFKSFLKWTHSSSYITYSD